MTSPYRDELKNEIPIVETDTAIIKIITISGETFEKKIIARVFPGFSYKYQNDIGCGNTAIKVEKIYRENILQLVKQFIGFCAKDKIVKINDKIFLNYYQCEIFDCSYGKEMAQMEKEPDFCHMTYSKSSYIIEKTFYKE